MNSLYKVSLFLFLISIFHQVNGQNKNVIKQNKIKSITVYESRADKDKKEIIESVVIYDDNGNIIEEKEYNNDGELKKHIKYEYDIHSYKVKEIKLDDKGNITETIEYLYEGNLKKERIVYDSKGKVKTKKRYIYTKYN